MIPGIIPIGAGESGPSVIYRTQDGSATNTSLFTFSNQDIGYIDPSRVIVVAVHYYEYDTSTSISSFTINGTAAPQRVVTARAVSGGSGSFVYTSLHSLSVPTSTTATIIVNFNRTINYGCRIGVWSLYNVSSAVPVATDSSTDTSSLDINVQPNDVGVVATTGVYGVGSFTWTNATERYDVNQAANLTSSGADFLALATETPRSVTATSTGVTQGTANCAAVWR